MPSASSRSVASRSALSFGVLIAGVLIGEVGIKVGNELKYALDNAINLRAAEIKHIKSPVGGRANVLIVPDLEAGNMLAKSLSFLADADAAGIVLGARVPIILTSRADSITTRLASCAVAALVAKARREMPARTVA